MSAPSLRACAIYCRLRVRFPSFAIVIEPFEWGGATQGTPSTTGMALYWDMMANGRRAYVRGVYRLADAARLERSLREAWRECRRWPS